MGGAGQTVPDLRDRFIIGAGNSYNSKDTGGSKDAVLVSHSHTINNHTHSFSGSGSSSHSHTIRTGDSSDAGDTALPLNDDASGYSNTSNIVNSSTVTISISGTTGNPSNTGTNSQGVSGTDKNLPPYYALIYIIKT